jgi:hypothetical protein
MACFSVVAVLFSGGALAVCLQLVKSNPEIDTAKTNFETFIIGILNCKWDDL